MDTVTYKTNFFYIHTYSSLLQKTPYTLSYTIYCLTHLNLSPGPLANQYKCSLNEHFQFNSILFLRHFLQ